MNLTLPDMQYAKPAERLAFHQQVLQRLTVLPGVHPQPSSPMLHTPKVVE